jgi:hypothetical protein
MNPSPSYAMTERLQLSLLEKIVTFFAWLLGGAAFFTIGWMAVRPDDPAGAVSLFARSDAPLMLVQTAALAGVAAAIGTILAGRRLSDAGTFAAAIGLAAVSLRGETVVSFLVIRTDMSTAAERALALRFAAESLAWFGVTLVAVVVSGYVARWCFGDPARAASDDPLRALASRSLAAYDAPRIGTVICGASAAHQTEPLDGLRHMLITAGVAVVAFALLSKGLVSRSIQHGQVCFSVFAAVMIAHMIAFRFVPVRSPLWSILAVPIVAITGYLWAGFRPPEPGLPPNMPASHFLRVLPIQFIAVGTVAALTAFWYVYREAEAEIGTRPSDTRTHPRTK